MGKKKGSKKTKTLGHFLVILFLLGVAYTGINIGSNYLYDKYLKPSQTCPIVDVSEENEDLEAILLATRLKLIDANVYIQVVYDSGIEIGSGVIIDGDDQYYYALTNLHVIDGNGEVINTQSVQTKDGITTTYEIQYFDSEKDLALIRFTKDNREELTPLVLGSEVIHSDVMVVSIGNPFGELSTINYGSIIRTTYLQELEITRTVIEHNATLAGGSSGGALVDLYGHLIGINAWELDQNYYAIPMTTINTFLEQNQT